MLPTLCSLSGHLFPKAYLVTQEELCVLSKQLPWVSFEVLISNFVMIFIIMYHTLDTQLSLALDFELLMRIVALNWMWFCAHAILIKFVPQYCEIPAMIPVLQKWQLHPWGHITCPRDHGSWVGEPGSESESVSEWPQSLSFPKLCVAFTIYWWLLVNVRATFRTREMSASPYQAIHTFPLHIN